MYISHIMCIYTRYSLVFPSLPVQLGVISGSAQDNVFFTIGSYTNAGELYITPK